MTAVLFARRDSIYKSLPGCDVFDIDRDARTYAGPGPVIAHPPCRAWGRLRAFAKPRPDERDLAIFAVETVRRCGGVLEHPASSSLWFHQRMPRPGAAGMDEHGGWTLEVLQYWFGHRAAKRTWLYIVGCTPGEIPQLPLALGEAPCVVESKSKDRPAISKKEREATPIDMAKWLLEVASQIGKNRGVTAKPILDPCCGSRMKLQKQKYRHDPDNGTYGDCHRTAVAMCLGLDRDDVPHFLHDNLKDWTEFGRRVDEFLATRGMARVEMPFSAESVAAMIDSLRHSAPLVPCILGGTSANGTGHSVVVFRGEMFDPSIDDSGLIGPMSDGYFWLTFFCPTFNIEGEA